MDNCIFCKIVKGEIPKEFTVETENVVAFPDIQPVAPVHILVIPKKHISEFLTFTKDDDMYLEIRTVIQEVIKKFELDTKGYRLGVNGGGSQLVDHVHFHVIGPAKKSHNN